MVKHDFNLVNESNIDRELDKSEYIYNINDTFNKILLDNQYDEIDNFLNALWDNVMTPCIEKGYILQNISTRDRYIFFNYMKNNSPAIKEFYTIYNKLNKKSTRDI